MTSIPALHVRFEGFTSSFRLPLTISGTQISTSVPSYSGLLGLISACAGRTVKPEETRIGFEFRCRSQDLEIERKDRLSFKAGRVTRFRKTKAPKDFRFYLKRTSEGFSGVLEEVHQGVGLRQVYWYPELDLYLTDLDLRNAFKNPAATPCLGRSQDVAWIALVRDIELHSMTKGMIGPTLLPVPQPRIPSLVVRLPEWMDNTRKGHIRKPGPFGVYQAMDPKTDHTFAIERKNLFHPSDAKDNEHVIYLHEWVKNSSEDSS